MLDIQQEYTTNKNNPFSGYQTFYLNLFANVQTPLDEKGNPNPKFVKGHTDNMHFRVSLKLDEEMLSVPEIHAQSDKGIVKLPHLAKKVTNAFLKSVTVEEVTINSKPSKQLKITLFAPDAEYYNPFKTINPDNPKNGTVVGALYKITSSLSLKGKELLNKLANINIGIIDPISIKIVNAWDSVKEQKITLKDKDIFNINVLQGEDKKWFRCGDPDQSTTVVDEWNDKFLEVKEKFKGDALRVMMDGFWVDFVQQYFSNVVHEYQFLPKLREMGYDLLPDGTFDREGNPKLKYVKLGEHEDLEDVVTYIEPTITDDTSSTEDEDLPF